MWRDGDGMIDLPKLKRLAKAATPTERHARVSVEGRAEFVRWCGEMYDSGKAVEFHWVDDEVACIAVTGNGPTSKANAELIAATDAKTIIALVEALEVSLTFDCHDYCNLREGTDKIREILDLPLNICGECEGEGRVDIPGPIFSQPCKPCKGTGRL